MHSPKNNTFAIDRLLLLLRREAMLNRTLWGMGIGVFALLTLALAIMGHLVTGEFSDRYFYTAGSILFIIGYFFTSKMFDDLHKPISALPWITLPASSFEKLLAGWLISAPGFVVAVLVILTGMSGLASLISSHFTEVAPQMFNPFTDSMPRAIAQYFVYHSIFFLGALYFKNYNFLKTVLAMWGIQFGLFLWALLMGFIFIPYDILAIGASSETGDDFTLDFSTGFLSTLVQPWVQAVAGIVVTVFCLIVSYIRIKERTA